MGWVPTSGGIGGPINIKVLVGGPGAALGTIGATGELVSYGLLFFVVLVSSMLV